MDSPEPSTSAVRRRVSNAEDEEIKRKISDQLPSRTMYRSKESATFSELGGSLTVPRVSSKYGSSSFSRQFLREMSIAAKHKKSILHVPDQSVDYAEIAIEDFIVALSEEEKQAQLAEIPGLPIPIAEKIKLRKRILETMDSPHSRSKWKRQKARKHIRNFIKDCSSMFRLWSDTLKNVEGLFGTGIVSYFVFLRFLLILNFIICLIFFFVIVIPQLLFPTGHPKTIAYGRDGTSSFNSKLLTKFLGAQNITPGLQRQNSRRLFDDPVFTDESVVDQLGSLLDSYVSPEFLDVTFRFDTKNFTLPERLNISDYCSEFYKMQVKNHTHPGFLSSMQNFLQGTGWMESTLLFIGYYRTEDVVVFGYHYNTSVAFLLALFIAFIVCVVMMVQYVSKGMLERLLTREGNVETYANSLFCSWDYCITNQKTATLRHKSIILGMKSTLAEARRCAEINQWTTSYKAKMYFKRGVIHVVVLLTLISSYYIIYKVALYQLKEEQKNVLATSGFHTFIVQFLSPITITTLNLVMPVIFSILVGFENYHAETETNITLSRIIFLRLSSLFFLVSSFYQEITCEPRDMCGTGFKNCPSPTCWETYVGQQLYKLTLTDLFVYIAVTLFWEIPRNYIVQKWKNTVTEMLGRQIFDLPSQVLALVYSQTLCWLGMFYSPLLPVVCVLKTFIIFYLKRFTVLHNCVPAPIPYKASRSNAIFILILLMSFFIVMIIIGFSLSSIDPSPGCSPFRNYMVMVHAIPDAMMSWPPSFTSVLEFLFSGMFLIPAIFVLSLASYYYFTIADAHIKMSKVLKDKMVLEGRDREFLLNRLTGESKHDATS